MMPSHIGQFEIKQILGSGGFGTVYAAIDTELGRWVAVKTLRSEVSSNPAIIERFRSEGFSLSRLNHTNITTLYGMPRVGQDVYLVMELVNGQTLDAVLGRLPRLGIQETLAIVAQTAVGLGYAHRMGVIHRDIKPSNLMLSDAGTVKIMDFGIARIRGTQRLTRGGMLGTYAYLAPEQFRGGEGSERSDLYSLACVVYEMLTGHIPFEADTEAEMMRGHLELPVRPLVQLLPGIDPRIDQVVLRALAKDPAARYANVEEFSDAIGASAVERASSAIIRDNILTRAPAPARPTRFDIPPASGDYTQAKSPATDLIQGKPRPAGGSSEISSRLPALLLGTVMVCVVAGFGLLLWQPWQTQSGVKTVLSRTDIPIRTEPDSTPVVSRHDDPPPVITADITPAAQTVAGQSRRGKGQDSPFIRNETTPGDSSTFIATPGMKSLQTMSAKELIDSGRPAADLVAEAKRRFNSGDEAQIDSAMTVLRWAARTLHNTAATAVMARLFDPNQPNRPPGLQPDVSQAAQNYRAAYMEGDTSIAQDREALRSYLEQRAHGNGAEAANASAVLDRFWR
jgi:serine/threonine protein kinase